MLYCLISFILGYLVCRMMGNGFSVGGAEKNVWKCNNLLQQLEPKYRMPDVDYSCSLSVDDYKTSLTEYCDFTNDSKKRIKESTNKYKSICHPTS